jgi:hypothetical protein
MSKENEIVAIFENELPSGKTILKGKTIKDVPAGTKVVLWPVDRSENPKRPAYRLEVDTYVPKAKADAVDQALDKALDEAADELAVPDDDPIPF